MGLWCVLIATCLYALTGISCFVGKDYPHAVMWLGYTFANLGLLWYEFTKMGQ